MKNRGLVLVLGCLLCSCVMYYPTARVQKDLEEIKSSLIRNHSAAQTVFAECDTYFSKLRNPAKEEPYLTAQQKLETARSGMQALTKVLQEVTDAHADFKRYSQDMDRIASNTPEWKKLKQTKAIMKSSVWQMRDLFDVYTGKNLPEGKKSYALSFTLLDERKTLTDKQIEKIMKKLQNRFETDFGAVLR